jgi:4-methylaminobutanoate oxidase (formaldehyde-forming)
MLEADEPIDAAYLSSGTWTVEIADRQWPCRASLRPLYDPANEKVKG